MMDVVSSINEFSFQLERNRQFENLLDSKGRFVGEHWRAKKSGNLQLLQEFDFPNGVTDVGKNYMLDGAFNGGTCVTTWYLGLIDGTTTPTLTNTDTAASHTGWVEFLTYNESVRQTWTKTSSSGGTVSGASASVFTIGSVSDPTYVAGAFVISNNVKTGTTGTLWATGLFTNPASVQPTDVFKLGYLTGLS